MLAENSRLRHSLAREGRLLFLCIVAILLIGGGIGTFIFFRHIANGELVSVRELVEQLRAEGQTLKHQVTEQAADLTATKNKLAKVQAALEAIMPSKNTYSVVPNQSVIVGDGRLTIGLVGSPANENVTLNFNGKQQTVVVGQVVPVAVDASTNCQVAVQSFDMFKVLINASCAPAKPQ